MGFYITSYIYITLSVILKGFSPEESRFFHKTIEFRAEMLHCVQHDIKKVFED